MGSNQSKLREEPAPREKNNIVRVSDLSGKDMEYVYVNSEPPPIYSAKGRSASLPIQTAKLWEEELLADPKNRLALAALSANPVSAILTNRAATIVDTHAFNIKIPFEGAPITNQRSSGRCWLFAATNVFRVALMKKYNLEQFELSQAYLFYWDKIEKANWFLENIIDTASENLEGRLVQSLNADPVGDGGQWDMAANLVEKYGLVPHALYPDSFNAENSKSMGNIITTKLREQALILRKMVKSKDAATLASIADTKDTFLKEIHSILTIMLGTPPSPTDTFNWDYYDSRGKFHKLSMTPLEFSASLSSREGIRACQGTDVHELFSLVNDPRNPYEQLMTVDRLGNVVGGRPVTYVNVNMQTIKRSAIAMLRAGIPVFFGSDVGQFSDSKSGIMDTALYDYSLGFNIQLGMSKASRLRTGESAMTHAMVLTAVHVEDNKPIRWRVQNSWGTSSGDNGWFVMTDEWMDEFVYQVVVDPRFVGQGVRDILKQSPRTLPLWDPMGALA